MAQRKLSSFHVGDISPKLCLYLEHETSGFSEIRINRENLRTGFYIKVNIVWTAKRERNNRRVWTETSEPRVLLTQGTFITLLFNIIRNPQTQQERIQNEVYRRHLFVLFTRFFFFYSNADGTKMKTSGKKTRAKNQAVELKKLPYTTFVRWKNKGFANGEGLMEYE